MTTATHFSATELWSPLPLADWQDTYQTLHLWTQIIGKIRVEHPKSTTPIARETGC